MKYYIIDGNNLIGKISSLKKLQKSAPQNSREKLYNLIAEYFRDKKYDVTIFFDGYKNIPLRYSKVKVKYSNNHTADDLIRSFISQSVSRTHITLISSDGQLCEFAKKCSCQVILSEEFSKTLNKSGEVDSEKEKIISLSGSTEEFIKLFTQKSKN
jgi:predicted RNA-binding protein with PIN domain